MNSPTGERSKSARRHARAEAAAWMAKLHGSQRSPAMEAGWRRWLAEHPDHETAWELATDSWCETGDLPSALTSIALSRSQIAGWTWRARRLGAIVATCLVVAGLAVLYFGRDFVTTTVGEQRTFSLADGTRVELNTNSRLIVRFDDHVRKVVLRDGEAYFNVPHERRPFVVVAGARKILAIGTSFLVRRETNADDALTVTLIEGRVAVAPVGTAHALPAKTPSTPTILDPGKRLRVTQRSSAVIDTPSIDKETAWMRGQLIFDNTPLRDAVNEFNRYNAVKLRVASQRAGEILVGGVFRTADAQSFAVALAQDHHLSVIVGDRELVIGSPQDDLHSEAQRRAP